MTTKLISRWGRTRTWKTLGQSAPKEKCPSPSLTACRTALLGPSYAPKDGNAAWVEPRKELPRFSALPLEHTFSFMRIWIRFWSCWGRVSWLSENTEKKSEMEGNKKKGFGTFGKERGQHFNPISATVLVPKTLNFWAAPVYLTLNLPSAFGPLKTTISVWLQSLARDCVWQIKAKTNSARGKFRSPYASILIHSVFNSAPSFL